MILLEKVMGKFKGFTKETIKYYDELKQNNNKEWFDNNRHIYDSEVLEPARALVEDFGMVINPIFNAIPKVNQSLFRIHRDTRFSKNKLPYKENLGIYFWEGSGKRMDSSGFYVHIEGNTMNLYTGVHGFNKEQLERYRKAVVNDELLYKLEDAIEEVKDKGYTLGGKHYKRMPAGYDKEHSGAEFLLYNSLWTQKSLDIPKEFYSSDLIDYLYQHHINMLPIHDWLMTGVI